MYKVQLGATGAAYTLTPNLTLYNLARREEKRREEKRREEKRREEKRREEKVDIRVDDIDPYSLD
jgi:hypothetical protein